MNHDRLTDQLADVFRDYADHAPGADLTSGAIRQAKRIRRTRRIGGAAIVTVAAVAIGVGVLVWDGAGPSARPPIGTDTSQTPTSEATIVDNALLRNGDVNPVGTYAGFRLTDSASLAQNYEELACLPRLTTSGADRQLLGAWFSGTNEGSVYEGVLQMPSVTAADGFVEGQRRLPDQCGFVSDTQEQTVHQPVEVTVDGADEALVWSVADRPLDEDPRSEGSFTGVGLARSGNVLVVITVRAFRDPTAGGWADWAAETLSIGFDRALG